jgi:hypothetical protein
MPWWRIAIYTAGILAFAVWREPGAVPRQPIFSRDGHAINSLDLAVTSAFCHSSATVSGEYLPGKVLSLNQQATTMPLRAVTETTAGSMARYCASAVQPYLNEDNSLSLLETLLIALRPDVSAASLARMLLFVKIAVIALVSVLMLSLGASVALTGASVVAAFAVLHVVVTEGLAYSIHSWFFVLVLLNATVFAVLLTISTGFRRWSVPAALAAGFVAAFSANMRSSYLPIYLAFALAYALAVYLKAGAKTSAAGLAAVVAGFALFQYPFIIRRIPDTHFNHTFHDVLHPVVLGLALPANDLAAREGIAWEDGTGVIVARRIDAKADYFAPGYDAALMTYYRALWSRYPREMLAIYASKLKTAGADMLEQRVRFDDPWIRRALYPLKFVADGRVLFLIFAVSACAGGWLFARYDVRFGFWSCLVFAAGGMLYLESAIVVPFYYPAYHNALLFIAVFWGLLAAQVILNAGVTAAGRWRAMRT